MKAGWINELRIFQTKYEILSIIRNNYTTIIINNMKHTEEGHRLKLFMEREGITQPDIAELLNVDRSQVSRYISGGLKVPLELVKTLHLRHKLNYSWFFHGAGTMKVKEIEQKKLMNDVTDILATLSVIMASQESMRDTVNKLVRDLYADKHKV